MINSYPSVTVLGHRLAENVLNGPVIIQEKIDGSQISFGIDEWGCLSMRSKNVQIDLEAPGMFGLAAEWAKKNWQYLTPNWIYRGEYLQKPKHNTLAYERVPNHNIILFDICDGVESYLSYQSVVEEGKRIGLETVPLFGEGIFTRENIEYHKPEWLGLQSILGGQIEGFVIKNYSVFTAEKKVAMAKVVQQNFSELNQKNWRKNNPTQSDILASLISTYQTEARWKKAVQHLRDSGLLEGATRDIPALLKEVNQDVLKECEGEIKQELFKYFWPKMAKGITRGLPEWYRAQLEGGTE